MMMPALRRSLRSPKNQNVSVPKLFFFALLMLWSTTALFAFRNIEVGSSQKPPQETSDCGGLMEKDATVASGAIHHFKCPTVREGDVYSPLISKDHIWPFGARPTLPPDWCTVENPRETNEIVAVPLSPFHACNGQIPRLTCLETIILSYPIQEIMAFPVDRVTSLQESVCQELVPAKADYVPVCLQTAESLDVLVKSLNSSSGQGFRYVTSGEAKMLTINWNRDDRDTRLVQRKVVAMNWVYQERNENSDRIRAANSNLGNHVWMYGAARLVNPATTLLIPSYNAEDYHGIGHPTAFILALANHLQLHTDGLHRDSFRPWISFVNNLRAPAVVLGIGISTKPGTDSSNMELFDYQKELLNAFVPWQSIPAIGTRGKMTTQVCQNSGISNCLSTGCPSLTISREPNLGQVLSEGWATARQKLTEGKRLRLAIGLPAHYTPELSVFLRKLGQQHDAVFILQATSDQEKGDEEAIYLAFNNTEEWIDYVHDNIDMVVSARIHGGAAGIASGTPTIVIPTDSRISELVDAMHLPHVPLERVIQSHPLADLSAFLDMVQFAGFEKFEENRLEKLAMWKGILGDAGIEMDPKLDHILGRNISIFLTSM